MSCLTRPAPSPADNASIQSTGSSTGSSTCSSGLTTPADEISQSFGPALVGSDNADFASGCEQYDELTTPKPRSLSKGFKQARKFAQNLMKPKDIRTKFFAALPSVPKSNLSPGSRFATRRSRDRSKRIISLPNQTQPSPCSEKQAVSPLGSSPILQLLDGTIPGNNTPVTTGSFDMLDETLQPCHDSVPPLIAPNSSFNVVTTMLLAVKVICFIPWCIAVGGAILLCPQYLEFITFQTGYLPSVQDIRRFAHWANYASQHLMIFIASTLAVSYCSRSFGVAFVTLVLARFIYVWQDFRFDRSIPLGQDDRQSLYMVMMLEDYGIQKGTIVYGMSDGSRVSQSAVMDEDAWLGIGRTGST